MERQQQFNYLNSFDRQITAAERNIKTPASQNLVNLAFLRACVNFFNARQFINSLTR